MKLGFCLPSPKNGPWIPVCGAKLTAHYELRNARKADISGKFAQNLNMLKRPSSTNLSIISNGRELVTLTRTR